MRKYLTIGKHSTEKLQSVLFHEQDEHIVESEN